MMIHLSISSTLYKEKMLVLLNKTEPGRFCFAIHNPILIEQKIPRTKDQR